MFYSNTIIASVGTAVFAFSQWGLIIAISKLMGPADVGLFALCMAIVNPIFGFSNLQLRAHCATAKELSTFTDYVGVRVVAGGVSVLLAIVAGTLYESEHVGFFLILLAISLMKYIDSLSDISYAVLQRHGDFFGIASSLVMRGILSLIGAVSLLFLTHDLGWSIFSVVLIWFLIFCYFDLHLLKKGGHNFIPNVSRGSLKLARSVLPMGMAVLVTNVCLNLPRYFIASEWGEYQVGVFSALAYVVSLFSMFAATIGTVISPELAVNANKKHEVAAILIRAMSLVFLASLVLITLVYIKGDSIINIFYTELFSVNSGRLFILLAIASFFWGASAVLDYGVIAIRKLKLRPIVGVATIASMTVTWYLYNYTWMNEIGGVMMLVGGFVQSVSYLLIICLHFSREN